MPAEPQLSPHWNLLEGQVMEGGYEVGPCSSATADRASFSVRILGDRFTRAMIEVYVRGQISPAQLACWRELAALRSDFLVVPLSAGETTVDGLSFVYCVWPAPDETLGSVLESRALEPEEVNAVTGPVLNALAFMHANGFAHGALGPEMVMAFGEQIRLFALPAHRLNVIDDLTIPAARYLAPESKGQNVTAPADFFCLGATLFEVLTRTPFRTDASDRVKLLPEPFGSLVAACLERDPNRRCDGKQARQVLRGEKETTAPIRPVPASSEERTVASTASISIVEKQTVDPPPVRSAAPSEVLGETLAEVPAPARASAPNPAADRQLPPPVIRRAQSPRAAASHLWLYVGLAVVLVAVLMWFMRPAPRSQTSSPSAAVAGGTVPNAGPVAASPSVQKPAWPTKVVPPPESVAHPSAPASKPARAPAGEQNWRVVAYTFMREPDARKRAEAIKERHVDLQPEIFSPSGTGTPYLVTLGGRMTKADADRLRQKARSLGLPRDTYIQNYNH